MGQYNRKNNSEGKRLQLDVNERLKVNALMPVSDIEQIAIWVLVLAFDLQ